MSNTPKYRRGAITGSLLMQAAMLAITMAIALTHQHVYEATLVRNVLLVLPLSFLVAQGWYGIRLLRFHDTASGYVQFGTRFVAVCAVLAVIVGSLKYG